MSNSLAPTKSSWKPLLRCCTGQPTILLVLPPMTSTKQSWPFLIMLSMSFPEEFLLFQSGKAIPTSSRLPTLAPEYDESFDPLQTGGRLRGCESLSQDVLHLVFLVPSNPVTKLLMQYCDSQFHHPGAEHVFAELPRKYWILRGGKAVRKHQHSCLECRKCRAEPEIPRIDLPPSSLRLFKPAIYSTGIDCFGPMFVKVGQ